jgi:hypothetical protein
LRPKNERLRGGGSKLLGLSLLTEPAGSNNANYDLLFIDGSRELASQLPDCHEKAYPGAGEPAQSFDTRFEFGSGATRPINGKTRAS